MSRGVRIGTNATVGYNTEIGYNVNIDNEIKIHRGSGYITIGTDNPVTLYDGFSSSGGMQCDCWRLRKDWKQRKNR